MKRPALLSGAALVVVAAAVVVLVVIVRGDSGAEASWPSPEAGATIETPSAPSGLPTPAFPAEPAPSGTPQTAPIPVPEPTTDETWDDLTELAEDEGTVPVIVTLRTEIAPEGGLPRGRRNAQRARIEASTTRLVEDLEGTSAANVEAFDVVPLVTLDATPETIAELRASPEVAAVVEDVPLPLPRPVAASAPQGTRSWTQDDAWWHIGTSEIETAWNAGYDGRGQAVAILDTGVQSDHPWLTGKVVDEACYSFAGNCPGGVDAALGKGSAAPCTFADSCGHGSHVAHDAAGKYGVARGADIIAVQVFSRLTTECESWEGNPCARTYNGDQLKGLQRVYSLRDTHKIAAVNMSLGGGQYGDYCDALDPIYSSIVKTLASYGIAVVISTGNESYTDGIGYPSCNRDAVAAGATTLDSSGAEAVANFSNRAPRIFNLLAPGEFICSAWKDGAADCGNGTSYASPLIAGTFATLRQLNPQASVTAMRDSMVCSGTPISDGSTVKRVRLNVWGAVNALKDGC